MSTNIKIVLVLVLVAALIVGGYLFWRSRQQRIVGEIDATPPQARTPAPEHGTPTQEIDPVTGVPWTTGHGNAA